MLDLRIYYGFYHFFSIRNLTTLISRLLLNRFKLSTYSEPATGYLYDRRRQYLWCFVVDIRRGRRFFLFFCGDVVTVQIHGSVLITLSVHMRLSARLSLAYALILRTFVVDSYHHTLYPHISHLHSCIS